jgi:hypothetical protein
VDAGSLRGPVKRKQIHVVGQDIGTAQQPRFRPATLAREDERGSMYDAVLMIMGVGMFIAFLLYAGLCEKM